MYVQPIPLATTVFRHTEATRGPPGTNDAVGWHSMSVSVSSAIPCAQRRKWSFSVKLCATGRWVYRSHVGTMNCSVWGPICFAVHMTLEALGEVDGDQQGDGQQQVPKTGHGFRVPPSHVVFIYVLSVSARQQTCACSNSAYTHKLRVCAHGSSYTECFVPAHSPGDPARLHRPTS